MSETAALAAVTASDTLICGSFSDSGVFSLGSSTSTSPSQNAMRSRKNIVATPVVLSHCPLQVLVAISARNRRGPLADLDKSQVIAVSLIRRLFLKKIAATGARKIPARRDQRKTTHPPFRNHNDQPAETCRSPFASNGLHRARQKPCEDTVSCRRPGRLSVRLRSL